MVALIELALVDRQDGRLGDAERGFTEAAALTQRSNLQDLSVVALYHLVEVRVALGSTLDVEKLGARCFELLDALQNAETSSLRERLTALLAQSRLTGDGHSSVGSDDDENAETGGGAADQ